MKLFIWPNYNFYITYSSTNVGLKLFLKNNNGTILWKATHVASSRAGNIPLSPIGLATGIFSAGNNGPNNNGVRSPQRINTNLVNTFCVGSINGNDESFTISTFSCRGPTQCPGEGSLSIYPEVVAPGQNVRSAWGSDSFNTISGTSMASPHVSGAVMLLKEAFPFLTGEEILLALYYTASDLGELGEDNTYGMGIIDAYAAFNYLTLIYEPVLPNAIPNDLILTNIINTPKDIECEALFTPTINILNNTDSIIEEIKIYYIDYLSQSEEDSIISQINLSPYQDVNIELPTINNGDYGIKHAYVVNVKIPKSQCHDSET